MRAELESAGFEFEDYSQALRTSTAEILDHVATSNGDFSGRVTRPSLLQVFTDRLAVLRPALLVDALRS